MTRAAPALAFGLCAAVISGPGASVAAAEAPTATEIVSRYLEARGGEERWRRLEGLELRGRYSAFSQTSEFRLLRARGDLYRLDFMLLEAPAIRARDEQGPWWQHKLMQPEPGRITEGPYVRQLERESLFGPALLGAEKRGIAVELLGPGEVEGIPTVDLRLTFEDGRQEVWHLDAETHLEVAVDRQIHDFTQSPEPVEERTFYDDFREVDGLVMPFRVDVEFGHRLESMTVEEVVVDPELDAHAFRPPAEPAAAAD